MKFALLGICPESVVVAQCLANQGHPIVAIGFGPSSPHAVVEKSGSLFPHAQVIDEWETLLNAQFVDCVIVAGSAPFDQWVEPLRKFAQAEIPLLVIVPSCESIFAYELEMIRADTNSPLVPFVLETFLPSLPALREIVNKGNASPIGKCEQLLIERFANDRSASNCLKCLASDAAVSRFVIGELNRITAMSTATETSYGPTSVSLSGPAGIHTQWSLTIPTSASSPTCRYTLIGTSGRVTLDIHDHFAPATLSIGGTTQPIEFSQAKLGEALVDTIERAMRREPLAYFWAASCRDLEIAETAQISMRKGRTVELSHDVPTERASFKAIMSMWGCGILMLILLVIGIWGVVAGVELAQHRVQSSATVDPSNADADTSKWPLLIRLWPVYPLALFLFLQTLLTVARGRARSQTDAGESRL